MSPRGVPWNLLADLVEVLAWSGVGLGVWLLTLSTVTGPELLLAACCALPCGIAARAGRAAMDGRWRIDPRWAWWLLPLLVAVVTETLRVWWAVLHDRGELGELRDVPAGGAETAWEGREAFASLVLSGPPGTYVVDADPDARTIREHAVASGPPAPEPMVGR